MHIITKINIVLEHKSVFFPRVLQYSIINTLIICNDVFLSSSYVCVICVIYAVRERLICIVDFFIF